MPFTYPYPRPAVTCDSVVFTMRADGLAVLLIRRREDPFKGAWALPGGFVNENEALHRAAARELHEETGLSGVKLRQLGAFGDPGRDPRGHTVTVAWVGFLVAEKKITAKDDADEAAWVPIRSLLLSERAIAKDDEATRAKNGKGRSKRASAPPHRRGPPTSVRLAFDHAKIVNAAYGRLLRHMDNPVRDPSFELLPTRFTLAQLQRTYEVVLGRELSAQAFKKQTLATGLVVPASLERAPKPAAQLYRWNRR